MKTRIVFVLITLLCGVMAGVQSARAAIIMVTNTNDSGPGSLRNALAVANDGDTIDATGISGTILLTSGELQITHSITINGPGAGNLPVNGNMTFRVFENFASDVTMSGLSIINGWASANNGGGILNHGALRLNDSMVSGSHTSLGSGGGIFIDSGGMLTVTNSTISGNGACCQQSSGGGICNASGGTLTVIDSTISANYAASGAGGIASYGQLMVKNSTITGNSSFTLPGGAGGGMNVYAGTATVTNSTISDNSAIIGGGIVNGGNLTVSNTTFSGNWADENGGGIHNFGTTQIGNTVLNAGPSGATIFNVSTITSLGFNLASDGGAGVLTGPGDQINTDPMLGPLQDNGGPTFTHALLPGSPAINTGDPSFTPPPFYDQRGPNYVRVSNGRIDIGSFEVQPRPTPIPRPSPTPRPRPSPRARPTS